MRIDDVCFSAQLSEKCTLTGALKDAKVIGVRLHESLSSMFRADLRVISPEYERNLNKILAKDVAFYMMLGEKAHRNVSGIITECTCLGMTHGVDAALSGHSRKNTLYEYSIVVQPRMFLMTLNRECRIFQNKTALEVVRAVLKPYMMQCEFKTQHRGKRKREYCVQYQESDFDFVSRILAEEGIFFYFKHIEKKHVCVFSDGRQYDELSCSKALVLECRQGSVGSVNGVLTVGTSAYVTNAKYSLADYNYTISRTVLQKSVSVRDGDIGDVYEYHARVESSGDLSSLNKIRAEMCEFRRNLVHLKTTIVEACAGHTFSLQNHPEEHLNKKYVIYSVTHHLDYSGNAVVYHNECDVFDAKIQYRPEQSYRKPLINSVQTAVVCAKGKEEVTRDKYGSVKVRFHWEREKNAEGSVWVRVASSLAGAGWGALFTPRAGQEVVVSFVNGDPDYPLIIGCVPNDKHQPAYKEGYISSIKTSSIENRKGFNELRFVDKKDAEELFLHAQKDMNVKVLNERNTLIDKGDDLITLNNGSRKISLLAKGKEKANYNLLMKKGDYKEQLDSGDFKQILKKGNLTIDLKKGSEKHTIAGDFVLNIKGNLKINVDGNIICKTKKNCNISSMMNIGCKAKQNIVLDSKMKANIKSGMDVQIKAGMNLQMSANLNAKLKANINSELSGGVAVNVSGLMSNLKGNTMCKISAPMVIAGGGLVKLG